MPYDGRRVVPLAVLLGLLDLRHTCLRHQTIGNELRNLNAYQTKADTEQGN